MTLTGGRATRRRNAGTNVAPPPSPKIVSRKRQARIWPTVLKREANFTPDKGRRLSRPSCCQTHIGVDAPHIRADAFSPGGLCRTPVLPDRSGRMSLNCLSERRTPVSPPQNAEADAFHTRAHRFCDVEDGEKCN